ncbi:hypothetical protein TNCV_2949441 [Trichonephila clavipes]|nr:hypothetical protein TNCV_2949441 [Trichonephila clavipes]
MMLLQVDIIITMHLQSALLTLLSHNALGSRTRGRSSSPDATETCFDAQMSSHWWGVKVRVVRVGRCQLMCHPRHLAEFQNDEVRRPRVTFYCDLNKHSLTLMQCAVSLSTSL